MYMAEKPYVAMHTSWSVIFRDNKYNEALQMFQQAVGESDELSQMLSGWDKHT